MNIFYLLRKIKTTNIYSVLNYKSSSVKLPKSLLSDAAKAPTAPISDLKVKGIYFFTSPFFYFFSYKLLFVCGKSLNQTVLLKKQGPSHWRSITEDLLMANRFCYMASAECDHTSGGAGQRLVPHRLLPIQSVLCSPLGAVFTFHPGQTTKSGPLVDLGFISSFQTFFKRPAIAMGYR